MRGRRLIRRNHGGEAVAERYVRVGAAIEPADTHAPAGVPVRLTLHRDAASPYRDAVVFPGLGRLVTLPPDEDVVVELGPLPAGTYAFSCPAGTPRGALVVSAPAS